MKHTQVTNHKLRLYFETFSRGDWLVLSQVWALLAFRATGWITGMSWDGQPT